MEDPSLLRSKHRAGRQTNCDDAGSPLRAIDLRDLPVADDDAGRPMRRLIKQIKVAASGEGGSSGSGQVISLVLTVAVFAGWSMIDHRVPISMGSLVAVMAVLMVVSWVVMRRLGFREQRGGFARTVVSRGYCGGCGYDLRTAAADASRFVECPECGARWAPGLVLSVPIGSGAWDQLGKGAGRVPPATPLATDDRGVLIRRIRSVPWRAPRAARRSWSDQQRRDVARARRRCGFWLRLLASAGGIAVVGVLAWLLFGAMHDLGASGALAFSGIVALLVAAALASAWTGEAGVSSARFVSQLRDAGICGCCGMSLDDAETTPDGFRVCGTCRSAWKRGSEDPASS